MSAHLIGWILAAAALILAAYSARALIHAATRHGRHERVEEEGDPDEQDLCNGCLADLHCDGTVSWCNCTCGWPEDWAEKLPPERTREELGFSREMAAVPAPGKDRFTDHDFWLPRTLSADEVDEIRERFRAAARNPGPPIVLPPDEHDITDEEFEAAKRGLIERHGTIPPSLQSVIDHGGRFARRDAEREEWSLDGVTWEPPVVASITDVGRTGTLGEEWDRIHPGWRESTFVGALLTLPLDRVAEAFDGVRP